MKTGVAFNGRFWDQLSLDGKMGYVIGAIEGIGEVPFHAKKDCACVFDAVVETTKSLYGEKTDALYIETAQAIDGFYKEPANKRIPVIDAMKYVAKKVCGATKQELEEYEAALRRSLK
jgi:methionine synthase I (cobalamin-dependent)